MTHDQFVALPPRPESVAEWEDLLVRLEIVPRVVRNTVDDVIDSMGASRALSEATSREATVGAWLEAAAGAQPAGRRHDRVSAPADDPSDLALRFASLRARTFAMVQRRGLDVWEWEAPVDEGPAVTVHQLLLWLARRDASLLAALRAATGSGQVGC